jgi:hypothetical protein
VLVRVLLAVMMGEKGRIGMKRLRHTPEQVIRKLPEADRLLAEGKTTVEVARVLEISENTYPPLAQPVRRDEGQRREEASEA